MSTLKQKLKKIPSPIREMIVVNIKHSDWSSKFTCEDINYSFYWSKARHIPDDDFWWGVNDEIELMP